MIDKASAGDNNRVLKPVGFARTTEPDRVHRDKGAAGGHAALVDALRDKHAQLETRNACLEAVIAIASAASSSLVYTTVVQRAVEALVDRTQPLAAAVFEVVGEEPSRFRLVTTWGPGGYRVAHGSPSPAGNRPLQHVVRENAVLAHHDPREPPPEPLHELGVDSWLGVPITAHDKSLGVLVLAFADWRAPFELEAETLRTIGRTLGMAMFNASQVERIEAVNRERASALRDRSRLEAQLRRAQRMETIGRMAGGIAHDFNNILTPIMTAAQLGQDELPPGSDELREDLEMIVSSAERAAELVKQILLFSRDMPPDRKPVDCAQLLQGALRMVRASLPATIEVRQKLAEDVGRVRADAVQLQQVLLNLCTNAAHAMRGLGGVLCISLDAQKAGEHFARAHPELAAGPVVHITISDTGEGMDQSTADRVFEPFFTTKQVGEGSGLGLSVVHGIVVNHDGAIDVDSEPERGTTFHLYLPALVDEQLRPSVHPARPRFRTGRERILLVDDESSVARVSARILTRLGYDVVHTSSSREALDMFRSRPFDFDLVLTDQTMPQLTGMELAAQLRELRSDIRVVLMSGYVQEGAKPGAAGQPPKPGAAGQPRVELDGILDKPFDSVSLGDVLRRALES